ncbi:hypothetical protein ACK3TF_005517 [Chlorella vulgaris]
MGRARARQHGRYLSRIFTCIALLLIVGTLRQGTVLELPHQVRDLIAQAGLPGSGGNTTGGSHSVSDAQQCPVRVPGYAVGSIALIHIPKTAGTYLHTALRSLMPQTGVGRWCTWGNGPEFDMPPVFSTCAVGNPGPDHQQLFEAAKRSFLTTCSGFTSHQDVAYFDAVGVDYSRTLTITALRHPVERVISAYYYSLRVDAPFLAGYRPANETDFSGLIRFVDDNPIDSNNLMTRVMAGARHCNWPGTPPLPPENQHLALAKQNLARICVIVISEFMDESLVRLAKAANWGSRRVLRLAAELEAHYTTAMNQTLVNSTPKPKIPLERAVKFVFWAGLLAVSVTWAAIGGGGTAAEAVAAVKTGRRSSLQSAAPFTAAGQCPSHKPGHPISSAVFVHVPKTAGTLLHFLLKELMPASGRGRWCTWGTDSGDDFPPLFSNCGGGEPPPKHQQLFDATQRAFLHTCSGFATHQDTEFVHALGVDRSRTLLMTALRHPVERVISGYYYSLKMKAPFVAHYKPANDTDFSGLVRYSRDNPIDANNLMTSHLGGARHCSWPGTQPVPPPEQRLEAAKRNLDRMCVIILAEFMDESLVQLARAAGWSSRRVLRIAAELEAGSSDGRLNATPKPKVPAEVRQAIAETNQLDMQLYQYALQLFMQRHRGSGSDMLAASATAGGRTAGSQRALMLVVFAVCALLVASAHFSGHQAAAAQIAQGQGLSHRRSSLEIDEQAELQSAREQQQCPVPVPGSAVGSIALIHIPKTAGTFLHFALRSLMPKTGVGRWCTWGNTPDKDMPPVFSNCATGDPGPDHQQLFQATKRAFLTNCSGFTSHQDVAYFDAVGVDYSQTLTITALRHPVERVISAYYYSLRVDAPFIAAYRPANETDFSGLIRFVDDNPTVGNNLMTQVMAGARHCNWPGTPPLPPENQHLALAKKNLARICVIVISEFMDESLVRLAKAANWGSRRVLRLAAELEAQYTAAKGQTLVNSTPKPKIPLEVRQAIERNNQLDMQLYAHGLRLFMRRSHRRWYHIALMEVSMPKPSVARGVCFPLGDDLLAAILSLLPPAALAAAEAVCRRWSALISEHGCWRHHALAVLAALGSKAASVIGACSLEHASWKQRYFEAQWCLVFDAASPRYHTRSVLVERAHTAAVSSLSSLAVPGCSWLASSSADSSVCLWNLEGRPAVLCRAVHPGPVLFVQLQSPETALSVCAEAAYLWRIEPAAGSEAAAGGSTAGAAAASRAEQQGRRSNTAGGAAGGSSSGSGSCAAEHRSVACQGGRKEEGCPPAFHFRLLRRIPFGTSGCSSGGGRASCAAAWDNWLAAGCEDGSVRLYDTYTGRCTKLLRLHSARVTALQHVQHSGLDLLVSGGDAAGRVVISDVESTLELAHANLRNFSKLLDLSSIHLDAASGQLLVVSDARPGAGSLFLWSCGRHLSSLPSPGARLRMASSVQLRPPRALLHGGFTCVAVPRFGSSTFFFCGDSAGDVRVLTTTPADERPSLDRGISIREEQRFRLPRQQQRQQQQLLAHARQHEAGAGSQAMPAAAAPDATAATAQQQALPDHQGLRARNTHLTDRQPHCTCICAGVPLVAGASDGRLTFWRWRRRPTPLPGAAAQQVAAQQAGAGVLAAAAGQQAGLQDGVPG